MLGPAPASISARASAGAGSESNAGVPGAPNRRPSEASGGTSAPEHAGERPFGEHLVAGGGAELVDGDARIELQHGCERHAGEHVTVRLAGRRAGAGPADTARVV